MKHCCAAFGGASVFYRAAEGGGATQKQ
jgi:hypothetical protein